MPTTIEKDARVGLLRRYTDVRAFTERLCAPLVTEDYVIQSMPDVSPTKWHLAHTSWFFETFVLEPHLASYRELDPAYAFLFNSYYTQVGERHCRAQRGVVSRPTVEDVFAYRRHVDDAVRRLLEESDLDTVALVADRIRLGLQHEQQHQELILTDIKHVLSVNPLRPSYRPGPADRESDSAYEARRQDSSLEWIAFPGGLEWIGHEGPGFAFDNESPRHRAYLEPFALAARLVTNGEFLEFMEDRGYERTELWLSLGWQWVESGRRSAPLYWEKREGRWWQFTLSGLRPLDLAEPVVHVSYFEAEAYARWAGARLPTEGEWESAVAGLPRAGNFAEDDRLHPAPAKRSGGGLAQMYGDVWEWTQSPYAPYPGFRPAPGALGEYNGKFMCNQFVLRGGSCATPAEHVRATYRNFFPPDATWQFTGLRLARDS